MPKAGSSEGGRSAGKTNLAAYCLQIGFFAGLIWGAVRWLAAAMHFTKVPAAFLLDPWVPRVKLLHWYWQTASFALFIAMSIVAAFVYGLLLKPLRGPIPGLLFGLVWWSVFYLGAGPLVGAVPPIHTIGWNSIVTDLCLFAVWGLFIGFSIAFEFHDEGTREPEPAGA